MTVSTRQAVKQGSLLALICSSVLLAACSSSGTTSQAGLATLDGKAPLVIAHRGASGYVPEETMEAYVRAIELGADVIEMDLVVTKDGVLVTRHDPNLAISTDVAKHPEFASRKKTIQVDGETQTGWFSNDFTLAEIRTLGAISTDAQRPQQFNGQYKIPTLQEVVDMAKAQSVKIGRTIAIYPETKNPTYFRELGLPMEDKLIAIINAAGWNSKTAPIYVQSFEPGSLKYMKSKGLNTRLIQLIDGDGIDAKTGRVTFALPSDRPYDWTKAGDKRFFDAMTTPAGLAEIKTYADGIGPGSATSSAPRAPLAPTASRSTSTATASSTMRTPPRSRPPAWWPTHTRRASSFTPSRSATSRAAWPPTTRATPRPNTWCSTAPAWTACSPTSPTPPLPRATST
jgi:glycerophosphoryl diester phosphodiesterase